jgi:hypothetical protein
VLGFAYRLTEDAADEAGVIQVAKVPAPGAPIAKQLLTRAPNPRAGFVTDTDISAAIYKETTGIIADGCVTRAFQGYFTERIIFATGTVHTELCRATVPPGLIAA